MVIQWLYGHSGAKKQTQVVWPWDLNQCTMLSLTAGKETDVSNSHLPQECLAVGTQTWLSEAVRAPAAGFGGPEAGDGKVFAMTEPALDWDMWAPL